MEGSKNFFLKYNAFKVYWCAPFHQRCEVKLFWANNSFFFPCIGCYSAFFSYFMALNLLKRSVVLEIARLTEQLLSILNNHFKIFL